MRPEVDIFSKDRRKTHTIPQRGEVSKESKKKIGDGEMSRLTKGVVLAFSL